MNKKINVINKSPNELPKYMTDGAAGMDVRAWCENDDFKGEGATWDEENKCIRIFPSGRALIHTGLYFDLPKNYEIQVRPRSGLALKQGITVLNTPGTIDSDYKLEVGIILINLSDKPVEIRTGDRIAQLVINKVHQYDLVNVDNIIQNGRGGFGSTNI